MFFLNDKIAKLIQRIVKDKAKWVKKTWNIEVGIVTSLHQEKPQQGHIEHWVDIAKSIQLSLKNERRSSKWSQQ